MKISNPLVTKALGLFGATLIRGWTATLDYRIVYRDPTVDPVHPRCRPRALYVLWHEYLICPLGVRGRNMAVLISQHRDGELITQVLRHLRFKVIRGSSTRGGVAALRRMLRSSSPSPLGGEPQPTPRAQRQAPLRGGRGEGARAPLTPQPHSLSPPSVSPPEAGGRYRGGRGPRQSAAAGAPASAATEHLIITPDGPRGPRRQLEEGAIFLAARMHIPIVCMGFAFDRPWRLNSWDQFAIPRPFSRARAVISGYLDIPSLPAGGTCEGGTGVPPVATGGTPVPLRKGLGQMTNNFLDYYRVQVEQVLNQVTQEAEHWAQAGNRKHGELPFLRNELPQAQAFRPVEQASRLSWTGETPVPPATLGLGKGDRLAS